jgi:hypothetical protein
VEFGLEQSRPDRHVKRQRHGADALGRDRTIRHTGSRGAHARGIGCRHDGGRQEQHDTKHYSIRSHDITPGRNISVTSHSIVRHGDGINDGRRMSSLSCASESHSP